MIIVSEGNLAALEKAGCNIFKYKKSKLEKSWLHVGLGGFHRAHQAFLANKANNKGAKLGICAFEFLNFELAKKLKDQDFIFSLTELDTDFEETHLIGSITDVRTSFEDLVDWFLRKETRLVTFTITPSGYFYDEAKKSLDWKAIENRDNLCIYPVLVQSLSQRIKKGLEPLVFIPCDNLQKNGETLKKCLVEFAERHNKHISREIEKYVIFANSVVDRVTPQPDDTLISNYLNSKGIDDKAPVFCEKYCSWLIESNAKDFLKNLDSLDEVSFVSSTEFFERLKIFVLNLNHFILGVTGKLLGHQYCHEAVSDPLLRVYLERIIFYEVFPALDFLDSKEAYKYASDCIKRFQNDRLKDALGRLSRRPEEKLKKFILPVIELGISKKSRLENLVLFIALCETSNLVDVAKFFEISDLFKQFYAEKVNEKLSILKQLGITEAILRTL